MNFATLTHEYHATNDEWDSSAKSFGEIGSDPPDEQLGCRAVRYLRHDWRLSYEDRTQR